MCDTKNNTTTHQSAPLLGQTSSDAPREYPERGVATSTRRNQSGCDSEEADIDWRYRDAFDEWQVCHFAYDHPEEGSEGGTIEEFLERFVPSPVSVPAMELELAGQNNRALSSYDCIISLLDRYQEGLGGNKRIKFTYRSNTPDASRSGYSIGGCILGSYPGQTAPEVNETFDKYCIAVEHELFECDPITGAASTTPATNYSCRVIARVVNRAKNLLFNFSACYVYVIAIYAGRRMRIYRFDHAGSISCGFDYIQKPHLVRQFLWRFVNPHHGIPHTVVGWDETIQIPSDEEFQNLKQIIKPSYGWLKVDKHDCRWLGVRVNRASFPSETGDDRLPYYDLKGMTFGPPLHKESPYLDSRATYVSRILVDIPGHGFHVFVVKDAWRPRLHHPESVFYEKIQERFPRLKRRKGFKWIKRLYPDMKAMPNRIPGLGEYYGYLDLSSSDVNCSAASSDDRGHSTVSRRFLNGGGEFDRVRGRILTGPVGGYLQDFTNTRELVTVIRDAVVGHYIARACGVLHRDISVGNILIAREVSGQVRGFIHDFDHAALYQCDFNTKADKMALTDLSDDKETLKGTRQFMAIGVLVKDPHAPHHDLESFYWVLVWCLLQYGDHIHEADIGERFFKKAAENYGELMKQGWLCMYWKQLVMRDNPRLNELMRELGKMISTYYSEGESRLRIPRHGKFVRAMQDCIMKEGWEEDDRRVKWHVPEHLEAFRITCQRDTVPQTDSHRQEMEISSLSRGQKRHASFADEDEGHVKKMRRRN